MATAQANIQDLGLIGKKIGMTQIFDADGDVVPVTVIQIAENIVTDIKTKERDGYNAVQLGGFTTREKLLTKPALTNLQKKSLPALRKLKEFRTPTPVDGLKIGDAINIEEFFKDVVKLSITGRTIGKGFQGGVKLHNVTVGSLSHGSKSKRQMGSSGAGTTPGNVKKGKDMPAQMGNRKLTISKVKFVKYEPEQRLLLVRGAVQGKKGGIVSITPFGIRNWNFNNKQSNVA